MRKRRVIGILAVIVIAWIAVALANDLIKARRRAAMVQRLAAVELLEKARLMAFHQAGADLSLQAIIDANYVAPQLVDGFLPEPDGAATRWQPRNNDMPLLCDRAGQPVRQHAVDQPTRYGALVFLPHVTRIDAIAKDWTMVVLPTHVDPNYLVVFNDGHAMSIPADGFDAALQERNEARSSRGEAPLPDPRSLPNLLAAH
ncbi:MAG: hypothetical protein U0572_15760 [Phycisphaerales bacterium]